MKAIIKLLIIFILLIIGCSKTSNVTKIAKKALRLPIANENLIDVKGKTISTRFIPPKDFKRTRERANSFGQYLRNLPLKPDGAKVKYFDGTTKNNDYVYSAVIDMEIGNKDLQQCADAVMRLRAEYLYAQKRYNEIHFNFISDGRPRYFKDYADAQKSHKSFLKYMDYIFSYANTASLNDEMKSIKLGKIKIGDVFIKTGNPYGHGVIVVDIAENIKTKKKVFLLAQSYMPAQEIQILQNPNDESLSPWYQADFSGDLETPEWTFEKTNLKRF